MDAKAVFEQALAAHQRGDLALAEAFYVRLLAVRPGNAQVIYLLGALRGQQGRHDEALELLRTAQAGRPTDPAIPLHMGNALQGLKRFEEAVAHYDAALAIHPRYDEALNNRGNALRALGRFGDALASIDAALAIRPDNALFHYNRGAALLEAARPADALADFERAVALQPGLAAAHNHRGDALLALKRADEACASYERALALEPGNVAFLMNRASALARMKRFAEAQPEFDRVLALDPARPNAFGYAAQCALFLCDWARMEAIRREVPGHILDGSLEMQPLVAMSYSEDPALLRRCAENTARMLQPEMLPRTSTRCSGERIRIAYVSSDLRAHPVGFQIAPVLERHDRARFEIAAVFTGEDDGSETGARIRRACDMFRHANGKYGRQIAEVIGGLDADIAVDLNGHTHGNCLAAFGCQPARVQASWLGYPGTTGAEFIDFVIADAVVLPREQQDFYSEKIVHLPDSFFPLDGTRVIGATPGRAQEGLPERGVVFCCFNQSWKITPSMFDIWMRLLKAVPGSVLWLKDGCNDVLRREAAARGAAPERLVFAGHIPAEMHLARHRLADLFLDTLPYNAHATAADALYAGLPVLTCLGRTFPGRVAASLLTAAGLPELVTRSAEDYEALALALARDPARLAAIKGKLAASRATAPLFDTARFTRNLEAAYVRMLEMRS